MILFNLIFLGLLTLLLYAGYSTEDIGTVSTAMFWFILLIFARYFDFFWELLPRSLFFMLGGFVLLVISIVLERKRRELKVQFSGREEVDVKVVVDRYGNAVIRSLLIGGEEVDI
ncbi:hypothetical protein [Methanosarcina mazei]|nr:hypothetical protein [Methanosarcina mazei]